MPTLLILLLSVPGQAGPTPLDLEANERFPGLVAEYRAVATTLTRLEPKPAFYIATGSPHPRLPAGVWEVEWRGHLIIKDAGPLRFSAYIGGELSVTVGEVVVLTGRSTPDKLVRSATAVPFKPGVYPMRAKFRTTKDVPPRVQLWWEGEQFAREVVPAWRFGHSAADLTADLKLDQTRARGQDAVRAFGCARCHATAMPSVADLAPGPALSDLKQRVSKDWLRAWLAKPTALHPGAHMPELFAANAHGAAEREILADYLAGKQPDATAPPGDHRRGRITFIGVGCATCHLVPDIPASEQKATGQTPFVGLADRLSAADIAAHLADPTRRYPDGRMPRIPLSSNEARDIASYLLLWSKPTPSTANPAPPAADIATVMQGLKANNLTDAATKLLNAKGCVACHSGLPGDPKPQALPIKNANTGCLTGQGSVQFNLSRATVEELTAYLGVAAHEHHTAPFHARQNQFAHAGCVRCHQRDTDRPPALEEIGSTLGGAHLQELPFLRTPRLSNPHQKFTQAYLTTTLRDGVSGLRWSRFSYRMPIYGERGANLLQALREADGELPDPAPEPEVLPRDPTLGTLHGARLIGFQGYACASCHVWNSRLLAAPDPGATGPDLVRTVGRIRRDWFERYLEAPARFHPQTPMPTIFPHGQPAPLTSVLDGDAAKQKESLWAYLALGKEAPSPAPPPALPIDAPPRGVLVAQIPIRIDNQLLESITLLTSDHDLLVYDLNDATPVRLFVGAQILRNVQGRIRQFSAAGTAVSLGAFAEARVTAKSSERTFLGYDRLPDGVRLRWQIQTKASEEVLRFRTTKDGRSLIRELPNGTTTLVLPAATAPPSWTTKPQPFPDDTAGVLERPGYKAIPYPRLKTVSGEDRIMPGALAVRPDDGKLFVASMKTGELFSMPRHGKEWDADIPGLFQDALAMLADRDGLYLLHRRNLTRLVERDGQLRSFDRLAHLPHGIADTYDMAYGLARDRTGRFVFGYAPYANATLPGSGGAIALTPGKPVEELAFGMRNPLGWCRGPDGEIFFSDNQGEWVATNKLGHVAAGTFQGFPNSAQRQHMQKPSGAPTVWVPYSWARSINGIAYDDTNGGFGPFRGQIFMAELMFGGAIIRANLEKVNNVYQGACFPFWGKGLLGPVTLAFDPQGSLYVGGITEPGWMAMPDRGAVYRIDYTGTVPFEMQTITVRPQGFRVTFTAPLDRAKAAAVASYQVEHYRYEYTGSYGSPELDRTPVKITNVEVAANGLSVDLTTGPLVKQRVYLISAAGLQATTGEKLVHPTGAYTLNEIPTK